MIRLLCLVSLLTLGNCASEDNVYVVTGLECWTPWFNNDSPSSDKGDFELYTNIEDRDTAVCATPIEMEVQTKDGVSAAKTGQIFLKNSVEEGFICLNIVQNNSLCLDYKIRFKCPPAFCENPNCWTIWFDRDDETGSGDWETRSDLHTEYPMEICNNPLDIEVRTVAGFTVASTKDKVIMSKERGVVCKASDNPHGCSDYKVRFLCPLQFCYKKECWTKWYNRGNAKDLSSWGVLASIKSNPSDTYCPEMLLTEIKGVITNGTGPSSQLYDDNGKFQANLYRSTDFTFYVRYKCNPAYCETANSVDYSDYSNVVFVQVMP